MVVVWILYLTYKDVRGERLALIVIWEQLDIFLSIKVYNKCRCLFMWDS